MSMVSVKMLTNMFIGGAKALEAKKDFIDELNVFPVPDGDTGTNMSLTIMAAAKKVAELPEDATIEDFCQAAEKGSLGGARGNSGVILSQIIRGYTKTLKSQKDLTLEVLAEATQKAVEKAYKSVMKPKEGTILTVAKAAGDKAIEFAAENKDADFVEYFEAIIKSCEETLAKTPEMLPVLKEAGVVDSGGQGLVEFLKGCYEVACGNVTDFSLDSDTKETVTDIKEKPVVEEVYKYKAEYKVYVSSVFNAKNLQDHKVFLNTFGECIKCELSDKVLSICVKCDDPLILLHKALSFGDIDNVKIDNLKMSVENTVSTDTTVGITENNVSSNDNDLVPEVTAAVETETVNSNNKSNNESNCITETNVVETSEISETTNIDNTDNENTTEEENNSIEEPAQELASEPIKEIGIIAVSAGSGLDQIFKDLGADEIITGGQTMNPSADDFVKASNKINAKSIFILPNNKNIIMAAEQVKYLVEDKEIIVIPTKTITQGITALLTYMPDTDVTENAEAMNESILTVKTGNVTYAVRDTVINGIEIKRGNIMGIGDKEILSVGTIVEDTALDMLEKMVDDDSEIIGIYYGEDVDETDAKDFAIDVKNKFPNVDIEIHYGGQPVYYYIISVE